MIQTYNPENYAIETASHQDYEVFYEKEMAYRRLLSYPPAGQMLSVLITDPKEETAVREAIRLADGVRAHSAGIRDSDDRPIGGRHQPDSGCVLVSSYLSSILHGNCCCRSGILWSWEKKTGLQIDLL